MRGARGRGVGARTDAVADGTRPFAWLFAGCAGPAECGVAVAVDEVEVAEAREAEEADMAMAAARDGRGVRGTAVCVEVVDREEEVEAAEGAGEGVRCERGGV